MIKLSLNQHKTKVKTYILTMTMILGVFAGMAFADDIRIDMQGGTATVPKGNTVNRDLRRIPRGIPGEIRLRLKWHAVNILPVFNRLRIQLRHGSRVLRTFNCYSMHANRNPKCRINYTVSLAEANRSGNWSLRITNNSNYEVEGFDVEKGSDVNPFVPSSVRSIYRPNCPRTVNLDMQGTTLTLKKGNTQTLDIYRVGKAAGTIRLSAKWHADNILPVRFPPLNIQLLKPNGRVALSRRNVHSVHSSGQFPRKFRVTYNVSAADAQLNGRWKIRVTNNSNYEIKGFNIEKGSDILVKPFRSTYKANCSF